MSWTVEAVWRTARSLKISFFHLLEAKQHAHNVHNHHIKGGIDDESDRQKKLLRYIQEVSFAIDDVVLYLDTHPYDEEALKYYKKYKKLYHEASEEYTQYYGPLQTSNVIADDRWTWVEGPWPWEGGC